MDSRKDQDGVDGWDGYGIEPAPSQPASEPASQPASWPPASWEGSLASQRADKLGPAPIELMLQVRERLPRCDVYFKLVDVYKSMFKIEVLAFVTVGDALFAAAFRTAHISILVSQEKMDSEVDLIVFGLAKILGASVLTGEREPIDEDAFRMFVEPA
jgi:hypothetical protein